MDGYDGSLLLLLATTAVAVVATKLILAWFKPAPNSSIPHVCGGWPLLGHAIEFGTQTKPFLEQCHRDYGGAFQFKVLGKTFVFLDGSFRDAFFAAPPKELSFIEGVRRAVPVEFTVGRSSIENTWHVPLIKLQFSVKGMTNYLDGIRTQVQRVLTEEIENHMDKDGIMIHKNPERVAWKCIAACSAVSFLGNDLGQRDEILNVFIDFHKAVFQAIQAYSILPESLLWLVASDVQKHKALVQRVVLPEIERRTREQYFPHDMLTVMIQQKRTPEDITERLMSFIMASMVTSAGALTHVLFDMASPGRGNDSATRAALVEEQRRVVQKHGADVLTQEAFQDMPRLKAFCWESLRCAAPPIQQVRYSMADQVELMTNDQTYSIRIPANAMVALSGLLIETDQRIFGQSAGAFVADRFLDSATGKLVTEDPSSLGLHPFGIGRNICPGRNFAMAEVMGSMATILRQYDLETVSGKVPEYAVLPGARERVDEPIRFVRRTNF